MGREPLSPTGRLYATYAALFLIVSVLVGTWMRAMLLWPSVGGGAAFAFVRHAHSHLALFGWVTPALFAAIVSLREPRADAAAGHRLLAHLLAALNVLTFASFVAGGYDTRSIVLSALHVVAWIAFARLAWPRGQGDAGPGRFSLRAAMVFLIVAGASTMAPVVNVALESASPWGRQLAVKLFLALFLGGWVVLGSVAAAYRLLPTARLERVVVALFAAGVPLTVFLHMTVDPPAGWEWLAIAGRAGALLVGTGSLIAAWELIPAASRRPLLTFAVLALAAKGLLELLAGAGIGAALARSPSVAVAYLHLVLVGIATPVLLQLLASRLRAPRRTVALGVGLGAMLLPVAALGWPWLLGLATRAGWGVPDLQRLAMAGGTLTAAACCALALRVTWQLLQASPTLRPATLVASSEVPASQLTT
jgi:hypothetical protein